MLPPMKIPAILLGLSAAPLAAALLSQYGFGLHPCELCLWQRVPLVALIALALAAFCLRPAWQRRVVMVSGALWLGEAGLAFYHVGVEQHWWQSASGCSVAAGASGSLEALRDQILGAPLVACDTPEFVLLGLSMAGWNVIYSLACVGLLAAFLCRRHAAY